MKGEKHVEWRMERSGIMFKKRSNKRGESKEGDKSIDKNKVWECEGDVPVRKKKKKESVHFVEKEGIIRDTLSVIVEQLENGSRNRETMRKWKWGKCGILEGKSKNNEERQRFSTKVEQTENWTPMRR